MGVASILNLAMRGLQFFWVLLIMSLVGNMIAQTRNGSPSIVNYSMFCAVFGMLSLFYLIPATIKDSLAGHPIILIVLDSLNAVFFFCCAVAFSAELGAHSCGNQGYIDTNNIIYRTNRGNRSKRCHEAQASTAFEWFAFAAFAVSAVLSGIGSRGSVNVRPGGVRGATSKV